MSGDTQMKRGNVFDLWGDIGSLNQKEKEKEN